MLVQKRDGRLEEFDSDKILESIKKAALSVEFKDDDIQKKASAIVSLKNQLIESGFDADEAEEQAELLFEGYIENGIYTEYDEDEAEDTLDVVLSSIDSLGLDESESIDTAIIQDFVEKALIITGHAKTAKQYIVKGANRARIREMNTSLMKSFEDLTFGKSKEVETKRENANIDGDSSMGTMLKYGSEGAKKFNLLYVVPPEQAEAHINGDIHIHDLDFYSLTETCAIDSSKVVIKPKGSKSTPIEVPISYFDKYLDNVPVDTVVDTKGYSIYIYDAGTFKMVKNCVRHSSDGKRILRIHSKAATIEVTDNHVIPVFIDGELHDTKASDITIGMRLVGCAYNDDNIKYGNFISCEYEIDSIEEIRYDGYVYDLETTSHYFMTNGVRVHNCCQIDIEKLFNGGFNTGHGFLREPGEIRSYAALACIAIQSNQNDMHSIA